MSLESNDRIRTEELDSNTQIKEVDLLLFESSSDQGVQNNGGRLGSRLGPLAIRAALKKLNNSEIKSTLFFKELSNYKEELENFDQAVLNSINRFKETWKSRNTFVHLGGGHDHIYVLLRSLYEMGEKKLLIINIDPHCDTRVISTSHSGNPFRRFANDCPEWTGRLVQVGISEMNNNSKTLEGIRNMDLFNFEQLRVLSENFSKDLKLTDFVTQENINHCDRVILSIDADVVESSVMEAVSAVSYKGIPAHYLRSFSTSLLRGIKKPHALGVYEYNPLFDNLSNKGSRYLAGLIYDYWRAFALQ